ncbi:MAG: type II toxin-antitoxin system VapB family antitoxin [Rhodocyclaceae bacterium]|jgi:Arc/MetJ family transcription regulator|nr:type II toxin-antitoxin system VapB family antitoxin [Rhodocyclaceae bacterium]MBK6555247.1 type II toxin-antitoxin system VapB family antitoxin [Rhodocyclaceae bacterium]MBK7815733.1 type II toxin-antitoxin system VapB family antitoxin [Rhodocyclaceae bacterium]MBK9309470.1 type II toxin-antitoxin system VapB family antitoxin [Rhodocyclaceae bacterium]MBK9955438.1 type II toxin-antitoxin system VapB family antitoxin [Rhodocyclaceae bacterium]
MRTNIVLDDDLVAQAMKAGPYKTKKEAVDAGLRLLARQAAYRDILALRGKLRWDDAEPAAGQLVSQGVASYNVATDKK